MKTLLVSLACLCAAFIPMAAAYYWAKFLGWICGILLENEETEGWEEVLLVFFLGAWLYVVGFSLMLTWHFCALAIHAAYG